MDLSNDVDVTKAEGIALIEDFLVDKDQWAVQIAIIADQEVFPVMGVAYSSEEEFRNKKPVLEWFAHSIAEHNEMEYHYLELVGLESNGDQEQQGHQQGG